jgi:hypothetical protein
MSLEPTGSGRPSFHRGSFVDELESARSDLSHKLLTGESPAETPSSSSSGSAPSFSGSSAPSLSPTQSATPSTPSTEPVSPLGDLVADSFAFAFDIDGVLIRGGRAIPEAVEAMKVLNGKNEYGIKMYVSKPLFIVNQY